MSKRLDEYTKQDPESGDSSLGVTSEDETRLFNLGTAASKDVTTSDSDDTSGRVLRIDDYLDRAGESDDAWTEVTDLDNGWTGTVWYILHAGWVIIILDSLDASEKTGDRLIQLPTAYKPDEIIRERSVDGKALNVFTNAEVSAEYDDTPGLRQTIVYPVL